MENVYSDKLFEFSGKFIDIIEKAGNVRILQIGETFLDKKSSISEHIQICHEITLVISGSGTLCADCEKFHCRPGDVQIISKGTKHTLSADDANCLRFIHFAFDFDTDAPKDLSEFYGQCKNAILRDDGTLRTLLSMLVGEYASETPYSEIMKVSLVRAVLVSVWRKINAKSTEQRILISENPIGNTVYNIIKYIDGHNDTKLTVNEIAKKFSYSSEYISRLFKQKTGVSLKKYIIVMRMKYAQTLLSEGKCSLSEITELTGYGSIQSFCKAFKKYTGYTPSKFSG